MSKSKTKTIQVFLRIRPPNEVEKDGGEPCNAIKVRSGTELTIGESKTPYAFHQIFEKHSRQEEIFDRVAKAAVNDAFAGFHGLLFVYGQTGTGKTHTIANKTPGEEGILQRAVDMVFRKIQDDTDATYEVDIQFIQIYKEVIQDLLTKTEVHDGTKGPTIRDDPDEEGQVYVTPLHTEPVYRPGQSPAAGAAASMATFAAGDKNRAVAGTKMNAVSSRSHTIFTMMLNRTGADGGKMHGRLILVDLAGCERQKKTEAAGERLQEAMNINLSLLVLGKVIKALTEPGHFVPYRESRLTRLLSYSLAGHGKTSIIVTCGPSERHLDETRSAVEFGQRAMTIKQDAKRHVEVDYKAEYLKLKHQVEAGLEGCSGALDELRDEHDQEMAEKEAQIRELEQQIEAAEADDSHRSPEQSPSRKSAAAAPRAGDSASERDHYKQKLRETEARCGDLRQQNAEKRREVKAQIAAKKQLNEEIAKLTRQTTINKSDVQELARKGMRMVEQRDERIEQLMYVIQRVKQKAQAEGDRGIVEKCNEAEAPALETARSEIDIGIKDGMSQPQIIDGLVQCIQKLRRHKESQERHHEEQVKHFDTAKQAIRHLHSREQDAAERVDSLSQEVDKTRQRIQYLKQSLAEASQRAGIR